MKPSLGPLKFTVFSSFLFLFFNEHNGCAYQALLSVLANERKRKNRAGIIFPKLWILIFFFPRDLPPP